MGKLLIAAACFLFIQAASQTQEPAADPIAAKITAAKDAFYAERDKAEQALIVLLEKKEAVAKQTGDIKTIEAVRAESEVFRKEGKLPKIVPLTAYETSMKIARTKLENIFLASIKTYTQANKIEEAKELQKQLEEIRGKKIDSPKPAADPLQPNTTWVGDGNTFIVLERSGDKFRARYTHPKIFDREVQGTIKENQLSWQPDTVRAISGKVGLQHHGTIVSEAGSYKIKMTYGNPDRPAGSFTLTPSK